MKVPYFTERCLSRQDENMCLTHLDVLGIVLSIGRLAQLDRALPSGGKGQRFESSSDHWSGIPLHLHGRLAQLDRALPSGGKGQRFESSSDQVHLHQIDWQFMPSFNMSFASQKGESHDS